MGKCGLGTRSFTVLTSCAVVAVGGATGSVAAANEPPPKCFEPNADGVLPSCTQIDGGEWEVSYEGGAGALGLPPPGDDSLGIPSGFVVLMVLAALAGLGVLVWRLLLARSLARRAGMNPNHATAVTLLDDDGLAATYLASGLRPAQQTTPSNRSPSVRSATERLRELDELKRQGMVTADEYQARRRAIIDSV